MTAPPSVSVVVPTFNRVDRLRRVVAALAAQDTDRPYEVVVVSDGSTDGTSEYLRSVDLPHLSWTAQDNAGPAAARNRGVEMASGELVLFVDDDVVASRGLIEAHARAHEQRGGEVVVIGPMLDPPGFRMSPWISWEQAKLAQQYRAILAGEYRTTAQQFYTGNASLRRDHLLAEGGFDTSFRRAEDVELGVRLQARGLAFVFDPAAEAFHYAERSYESWRRNAHSYGRNDVIFARRRGDERVAKVVRRGWYDRSRLARGLSRAALPRPRLAAAAHGALRGVAVAASAARLTGISHAALSAIYISEYHRGMADELGGVDTLLELVERPPA